MKPEKPPTEVLVLSATSRESLIERAASWLAKSQALSDGDFPSACARANIADERLPYRVAAVAETAQAMVGRLGNFLSGKADPQVVSSPGSTDKRPAVAFLFSGQGCEYVGMGHNLYLRNSVFRAAIDQCRAAYGGDEPFWPLLDPQRKPTELASDLLAGQLSLFSIEYALSRLWKSWGVEPSAVMGFSLGEYCAAHVAEVLSLGDALTLVSQRAKLLASVGQQGAMVNVFADEPTLKDVANSLEQSVSISAFNGPRNFTVAGTAPGVEQLLTSLRAIPSHSNLVARVLPIQTAAHSVLLKPILDAFETAISCIRFSSPRIPMVSTTTGGFVTEQVRETRHWRSHLRQTVLYAPSVQTLLSAGTDVFLEVGPHTALIAMTMLNVPAGGPTTLIPSLRRAWNERAVILESLMTLYVRGASVNWDSFYAGWRN